MKAKADVKAAKAQVAAEPADKTESSEPSKDMEGSAGEATEEGTAVKTTGIDQEEPMDVSEEVWNLLLCFFV